MSPPLVVTLGCRLNTLESQVIQGEAVAAGLTDAVIVNTCAVTGEAVRQARQTIRKLHRQHPGRQIIVTGCAAQLTPEAFARMPEVDRVLGNVAKLDRAQLAAPTSLIADDIMSMRETAGHLLHGFEGRTRAFVQVQQGCDHRCTFCIIPFARGPNRSVPIAALVEAVRQLVAGGHAEVVLTGVDICSYGLDLDIDSDRRPTLTDAVAAILDGVPDLRRLRLSSLDPAAIGDDLIALFAREPRLMPHVHLSLQAADDLVLKRMRRRHSRADASAVIARLRAARPEMVFGADLIAGFPTESDEAFTRTFDAIAEFGLTWLHVFPYSPREGTPAGRMPQVAPPVRQARAAALREAGAAAVARFFAGRIGSRTEVLVERDGIGRCPWFAPVRLDFAGEPGSLVPVHIIGADTRQLYAREDG